MFTSSREIMRAQVNARLTNVLAFAAVALITAMNVVLLAQKVVG
jgi:Mn2+/Fe2+ NRAMP family transporter